MIFHSFAKIEEQKHFTNAKVFLIERKKEVDFTILSNTLMKVHKKFHLFLSKDSLPFTEQTKHVFFISLLFLPQ